jgi:starvation-inducible DNA-binding protein
MEHHPDDVQNLRLQMQDQPVLSQGSDVRHSVVVILNQVLSSEVVLTQKTRTAYWTGNGAGLWSLRKILESQFRQLNNISDEVAERVRMLGGLPVRCCDEIFKNARRDVQSSGDVPAMIGLLLADHEASVRSLREDARKCSGEYQDIVTSRLLVDILSRHEKIAWMLRSYIENDPVYGESQKRKTKDE